jgi:signal transduction histidine kinase
MWAMGHVEQPDLAHRLRTPLAVIVGYVEILAMRDTTGENAEVLDHLREASGELAAVIDDVVAADARDRGASQG